MSGWNVMKNIKKEVIKVKEEIGNSEVFSLSFFELVNPAYMIKFRIKILKNNFTAIRR